MPIESVVRNEDQKCVYRSINSEGTRVLWEITSACNLRCDFCLVEIKQKPVSLSRALDIARALVDHGVEKFLISGGEPLLYPDLQRLLQYLLNQDVLVKLLTNGTIHDEEIFRLIEEHSTMEVSLSLQSVREDEADAIFGRKGSLKKVLHTIERLPKERLNIICAAGTVNAEQIEEVIDFAAEQGVPCISVTNIFKSPTDPARFRADCLVYRLEDDRVAELMDLVARKRAAYRGRMVIRTTQFFGSDHERCGAGRSVLYVDSTGCVLPCTLTDNDRWRDRVRDMPVDRVLAFYREDLPEVPPSSCSHFFQMPASA